MVTYFIYTGRVISVAEDDWTEVVRNLENVRAVCQRMTRILSREGVELRASGFSLKPWFSRY